MKRHINYCFVVYELLVFYPVGSVLTVLTALITIVVGPISKGAKWGYYPAILWARAICALAFWRIHIRGSELYDRNRSYVFMANHQSIADVFPIYGYIGSRFVWIMKKELRKVPFIGKSCEAAGHIFIDRSSAIKSHKSLQEAERKLRNGLSVVVFPEGSRSADGQIGRFKRATFSLATDLHLPIVPVTIKGTHAVMPKGTWIIQPGTIELIFHEPMETDAVTSDNLNDFVQQVHDVVAKDFE